MDWRHGSWIIHGMAADVVTAGVHTSQNPPPESSLESDFAGDSPFDSTCIHRHCFCLPFPSVIPERQKNLAAKIGLMMASQTPGVDGIDGFLTGVLLDCSRLTQLIRVWPIRFGADPGHHVNGARPHAAVFH